MQIHGSFNHAANAHGLWLPSQGSLRSGYLKGLKGLVQRRGIDARALVERQELDPLVLDDPDRDLACMAAVSLLEQCSELLDDPLFGLHLAELQEPDAYGCVIALARAAPTFGDALQCLVDFTPLSTSPECEIELLKAREVVELRWRTHIDLGNRGQTGFHGIYLMMKILRMLGGEGFRPRHANLGFRLDHGDTRLLQDKLGCRVYGSSGANAIAISREYLDQPIATANRTLYTLLKGSLTQLGAAARADFPQQVEAAVCRLLAAGNCSVDACASALGTSTRTLQKRLTGLGLKFSDIVQDERMKLAMQALRWTDCSLDDLAFQLGYAEQTSFGRAFKRYTGVTPNGFRVRERRKS